MGHEPSVGHWCGEMEQGTPVRDVGESNEQGSSESIWGNEGGKPGTGQL